LASEFRNSADVFSIALRINWTLSDCLAWFLPKTVEKVSDRPGTAAGVTRRGVDQVRGVGEGAAWSDSVSRSWRLVADHCRETIVERTGKHPLFPFERAWSARRPRMGAVARDTRSSWFPNFSRLFLRASAGLALAAVCRPPRRGAAGRCRTEVLS
jgi:hypothetical protein